MRIGMFYGRTYPPGSGGSVHGFQLTKCLSELGHTICTWYYDHGDNPHIRHFRRREWRRFLNLVDVLYVRIEWKPWIPFFLLRRIGLVRIPIIWELNGLPGELIYQGESVDKVAKVTSSLQQVARHIAGAVGVTPSISEYLSQDLGISMTKCIPNGSDPTLFYPSQNLAGATPLTIVWMGNPKIPWHDTTTILEAARELERRNANARILMIGNSSDIAHTVPTNVHLIGSVRYGEVGSILRTADVGIHLFRSHKSAFIDGSPLKLFDYMASGLAILAGRHGHIAEIVETSEAGLLVSNDPISIANRIQYLIANRHVCRQFGANARRAVEAYYNWTRVAGETVEFLKETLETSNGN